MKILALGHQSRVGKDTFARLVEADVVARNPSADVRVVGFADALKQQAYDLFCPYGLLTGAFYERPSGEPLRDRPLAIGKTPVELWIEYGQAMRSIYEDVWVDRLLGRKDNPKRFCDLLIVKDMRFMNEAQRVKDLGGFCLRVARPDAPPPKASDLFLTPDWHGWDGMVLNDGTLRDLEWHAHELVDRLGLA